MRLLRTSRKFLAGIKFCLQYMYLKIVQFMTVQCSNNNPCLKTVRKKPMENVHCYDLFTDRWWRAVFSVSQGLCVPDYRMCIAVSSLHNSSFIQWNTQHIIISEMCTVTLIPNAQCTIVGSQIYSPIHLLCVFIHFTSVIFIIKANTMIIKAESFHPFMKWHIDF